MSLEILNLIGGDRNLFETPHKFTGGIPAEWSSMTNLKQLRMAYCSLDGESDFPGIPHRSELRVACIARTGPIPVDLLRWKFVEGRTVELKNNSGLELPANIGELGDSVKEIDLSGHNLRGAVQPVISPL